VISASPAGCSLGVRSLPGFSRNSLERDSSRSPLTRFTERRTNALFVGVSECQSALAWSFPNVPEHRQATDKTDPHRVFAPCRSCSFGGWASRAMYSPHVESCITVDLPTIFEMPTPCRS
jgi:hypothetical protein